MELFKSYEYFGQNLKNLLKIGKYKKYHIEHNQFNSDLELWYKVNKPHLKIIITKLKLSNKLG